MTLLQGMESELQKGECDKTKEVDNPYNKKAPDSAIVPYCDITTK